MSGRGSRGGRAALANLLAGRGRDGTPAPTSADGVREVVTQLQPLMSRPVSGGPPATVQWTDAVRGCQVDDIILVQHRGVCRRTATALLTPRPIADKYAGETVGSVNGNNLTVGGSVELDAGDVGAYPTSHQFQLPASYEIRPLTYPNGHPDPALSTYTQRQLQEAYNTINDLAYTVTTIVNYLSSAQDVN